MKELAQQFPKMMEAGIAIHAITAETGGNEAVKTRLAARHCADLPFPVHSDPDARLCAKPGDGHYITCPNDPGKLFKGDYVGVSYTMVQPALEIVDRTGTVVRKWSWHSIQPPPSPMAETTKITVAGQSVWLFQVKPMSADILPAIREGRDVKLSSPMSKRKIICSIGGEMCTIM